MYNAKIISSAAVLAYYAVNEPEMFFKALKDSEVTEEELGEACFNITRI